MSSSKIFRLPLQIKRILLVAAMDVEAESALAKLPSPQTLSLHEGLALKGHKASIQGREIALFKTGIGLVHGALITSYAIDQFQPDAIFLIGVAGALKEHLGLGEVVVARQVLQHDAIYSGESNAFMPPGDLYDPRRKVQNSSEWIATDDILTKWAVERLSQKGLVHTGTVLSGSEFVGNSRRKKDLSQYAEDALAVEMEAAGVGLIARKRGIPFVVAKTIADRVNPDGTVYSEFVAFTKSAAENAAQLAEAIIDDWSA